MNPFRVGMNATDALSLKEFVVYVMEMLEHDDYVHEVYDTILGYHSSHRLPDDLSDTLKVKNLETLKA